ncbi:class I SAM-dependent methyltransferase [Cellulomonas fengjieae]|uniref:class I SAM-dependent methyltransferase n=1 Tax=Cellulomonas fengjieae TaxID=2819978 RepID=UPI001AAE4255|nr:class I SAM-dependent methyltransferase [Cellulomonas fengjieae]MBO3102801.1 class I SAM-dependent methyltransferase [Cellulomonas fengjieae]
MDRDWEWDPTLFAGTAAHYAVGRMAYPPALADALRDALSLDGTGRLLDVGCGPGSLTLLLAPLYAAAVGVDPDPDMLVEARRAAGALPVQWRRLRAEELPADLGRFRTVVFAQSFHWMDQPLVAERVRAMLDADGAWVHVSATTHRGVGVDDATHPHPQPPWEHIDQLVQDYLGPVRRAGRGTLPDGTRGGEDDVMRAAGYRGPQRLVVPRGEVLERTTDDVVAAVLSLSSSAAHLFADRFDDFVHDLRLLLGAGPFSERARDVAVAIWRP